MRVALVYRNVNFSGSLERDVALLAGALSASGVETHVYCNPATRAPELEGITFHDVRPVTRSRSRFGYPLECGSFAIAATRALRRDRAGYDVVDVTGIAAWEQDVVTVHAVTKGEQERWASEQGRDYRAARARARLSPVLRPQIALARAVERLQFRPGRFVRAIAVTELVRDDLVRTHGVPLDAIDVIHPPADLTSFARRDDGRVREELRLPAQTPALLFIGHAFERKGLADAIAALAGLTPAAHLIVVGNGDSAPFEREAQRIGVAGRVHFVGATDDPASFYAGADILVLPTRHDPWCIPLIEAMASGVPVVTTDVAGAAGVVAAAGAGLVLRRPSPAELREAIGSLLRDPARRHAMGRSGQAAASAFGLEAHTRAVLASYERVLRGKKRPAGARP